ncbi:MULTISPECIES: lipase family protein [Pseudomonas]|uniref:lipase family protein n=1 Tax=Pseudomonas TaxID=286 RepID=UPI001BEC2A94|nr:MULTISPECIES: lipase family protein [Pseudomonas]MBT2339754.1 lipase family protein [Pseudomonas fluorescens]MCD4528540.1 lipase family protein [Pseudomonas sp. C3-2018]
MNDTRHRTDTLNPCKVIVVGEQKKYWIEFQLVDEQGDPLANMPYRALNEATCTGYIPEYSGQSDAQGLIRIEGLHPLPITLMLAADPLAEQLQTRRLRTKRSEPSRPGFADRSPLHQPQCAGFSCIEERALADKHDYHYLRIGQLCDRLPTFNPPLEDPANPPEFHFPDRTFSGFTFSFERLNRRHVLEICPLRAWALVLHHQPGYSLANAYNLGLMSILAYSSKPKKEHGSIEEFFSQQCLDLSRTPRVWDDGANWLCLVRDVPFNERYTSFELLDTSKAVPPEGHTQLFYAISGSQVLVAWRGTETQGFDDLLTDVTFRPVAPEVAALCKPMVPCDGLAPEGSMHLGFRNAFEVARRIYVKELGETIPESALGRKLFICGHSLGGALGLVHAASLKNRNPVLYTYGMPRTFSLKAVQGLSELVHFRHVNDTDLIPSVPPEAALDNYLYDLYGPLGTTLGFTWSLAQLAATAVVKHGDPYCHHGEVAMFFRAEQHIQERGSFYPAYRNKEGLGAPYHTPISRRLPHKAKFYLVPSLSPEEEQKAEAAQKSLVGSLKPDERAAFFPRYSNPKIGRVSGIGQHFMKKYQPYLHNHLLEAINAERKPLMREQQERQMFVEQMREHCDRIHEDERNRNRVFLHLQGLLGLALGSTWEAEGGIEALQRFDGVADPDMYHTGTFI